MDSPSQSREAEEIHQGNLTLPCWLQSLVFCSVLAPGAFIIAELNQEL